MSNWQIRNDGAPIGAGRLHTWHGIPRLALDPVTRQDAAVDTMILEQQLQEMEAEVFRADYPEIKTSAIVPVDVSGDPGDETYAFASQDGNANWGLLGDDARANTAPGQSITREKDVAIYYSFAHAFGYTINDIRKAARAGIPLSTEQALLARESWERTFEGIVANGFGSTSLNSILAYTGVNSTDVAAMQTVTDGAVLLAALVDIYATRINALNGVTSLFPNRWVLPPVVYFHAAALPHAIAGGTLVTDRSVLDAATIAIKKFVPDFEFDYWSYCDSAEPGGVRHRSMLYRYDPRVLRAKSSVAFEMLPVQPSGFGFQVPCHARTAGVVIHKPVGVYYVDIAKS